MKLRTTGSRQINSKDLCISEAIETLQSKKSFEQKSCQILNKTTAVFDKVKSHTENLKTLSNNSLNRPNIDQNKTKQPPREIEDKSNKPNRKKNITRTENVRKTKDKPRLSRDHTNTELQQRQLPNSKPTQSRMKMITLI